MARPIEWYGRTTGNLAITSGADYALSASEFETPYRLHLTGTTYLSRLEAKSGMPTSITSTRNVIHGTSVTNSEATFFPPYLDTQAQGDVTVMFYKDGAPYEVPWSASALAWVYRTLYPETSNLYVDALDSGGSTIASYLRSSMTSKQVAGSKYNWGSAPTISIAHYGFRLRHANPGTTWTSVDHNPVGFYMYYIAIPGEGGTHLRLRQSPLRTPSRIRDIDTRTRQTPTIVK